jgi:hypothetical protein
MKFKRVVYGMVACALLGGLKPVSAGVTVTLVTAGGTGNSVTVAPGASFSVDIRLDIVDVPIVAAQVQLLAVIPGVLDVVGGSYNATDWNPGLGALPIDPEGLDPLGPRPIGSLPQADSIGPGTTILATMELSVDTAAATGTYTLNATAIVAGDEAFTDISGTAGPDFNVIVSGGGTTPGGGGGTTPPDDGGGGTTPPDDGGGGVTPPDDDGGGTTPPDGGGGTTPPDDGGGTTPSDGGSNPSDNGNTPPVIAPHGCGAGIVESAALSFAALLMTQYRRRK